MLNGYSSLDKSVHQNFPPSKIPNKDLKSLMNLRYCKVIANFLLWEFWECSTIPIKNNSINLWETFILICMQEINFITHFFLKILQRNSKLVILGNLDMSAQT